MLHSNRRKAKPNNPHRLTSLCLFDSNTNAYLGKATAAQCEASWRAGPEGHILIDTDDGLPIRETHKALYPDARRVYVGY